MPTYNPYTETHALEKYQFLHHFLPHPETKRRAKLLSHTALFVYSLTLILIIGVFQLLPRIAPGVLGYASNISITSLLQGTNGIRQQNELEALRINPALMEAAQRKAAHMFENGYWSHIAPDGTTPWEFILAENYDYIYAGENLAKNFSNSDQVIEAWYKSPSHKENLLNKEYEEIGFAVVNGVLEGYETTLVVQLFGRPRVLKQAIAYEEPEVPPELVAEEEVFVVSSEPKLIAEIPGETEVLPAVDVTLASKGITLLVGGFLLVLLLLDVWYTKKKAIPKVTGPAFAHILMLVFTLVGVWFALSPGKVL